MKKFLQQILFFFSLLIVFRLVFVFIITLTNTSSNHDYGEVGEKQIIIVGSSNCQHGFDYDYLNEKNPVYAWRSCYLPEPHGLFLLLQKLKKIAKVDDIIIFDLPYSLYDEEKFSPNKNMFYQRVELSDYTTLALSFPRLFAEHMTALTIFNTPDLFDLKQKGDFFDYNDLEKQDFDTSYMDCSEPFDSTMHNIRSTVYNKKHIEELKKYIYIEFSNQNIYFCYPEINTVSSHISTEKVKYLGKQFHFLNDFKNSAWEKEYLFDQWYHLNHCGALKNSEILLQHLPIHKPRE